MKQKRILIIEDDTEINNIFEQKEYMPELLFEDSEILERLKTHPMALWKCRSRYCYR